MRLESSSNGRRRLTRSALDLLEPFEPLSRTTGATHGSLRNASSVDSSDLLSQHAGSELISEGNPRKASEMPSSRLEWDAARRRLVTQYETEDPTEEQRRGLVKSGRPLHETDPPRPESKTLAGRAQNLWRRLRGVPEYNDVELDRSTLLATMRGKRTSISKSAPFS